MKKLSIADVKASEILSTDERKMIVGGSYQGWCYGTGHWSYPQGGSYSGCRADVARYCSGGGYCFNTSK